MKHLPLFALYLLFIFCSSCKSQTKTDLPEDIIPSKTEDIIPSPGPGSITRNIIQDSRGNIWLASFEGIIRYDGKSFTNITHKVDLSRFFSVLEDRKGNFWFASIGSGVYYYDGKTFQNFTSTDGLPDNRVTFIYEDKAGNIWFGTEGGASRYDGKSFRNYTTNDGLPDNDVSTIIEDKSGKIWFGTRAGVCIYDGKTATIFTRNSFPDFTNNEGIPFKNVRSIIEDKNSNIWLGGDDGLWRYDGITFRNFTRQFVGYIYEDKSGNIWISAKSATSTGWAISRYDAKSLSDQKPMVTEIKSNEGMIFGILEANDASIWFGTLNGVYRYDGITFNDFQFNENPD